MAAEAVAGVLVRRRLEEGEFAYVFLATGEEIAGKKAAYKRLKAETAVFEALREEHGLEGETDLMFDSRILKILTNVPFEDDAEIGEVLAAAEAAMSSPSKRVNKDWEEETRIHLGRLVSRRRLEGGEFTYVYLPLSKPVAGKKAMFKYLKSQGGKYSALVKAAKDPHESEDQWEGRVQRALLVVPYEKVPATPASTSKVGSSSPTKAAKQGSTSTKRKVAEVEEMEVEEVTEFSTLGPQTVYPVFCQPVLVALGDLDENTRFVKLSLSRALQAQANASDWELLRDPARVFWKGERPHAFAHVCPNLPHDARRRSGPVAPLAGLEGALGTYRALDRTDEEQRNLSTRVTADMVVTQGPGNPARVEVGAAPVAVLVTLVLRPGSLTQGDVKQFELRPSDVLVVTSCAVEGITMADIAVSVDRRAGVPNRSKVVVTGSGQTLKTGQILGQAILFQHDVKLLWRKHEELMGRAAALPCPPSTPAARGRRRPCLTVANSRLYSQGNNPLLVKLDQFEATKAAGRFARAHLAFSEQFKKVIEENKKALLIEGLSKKDATVEVVWRKAVPYAFLNVRILANSRKPGIDFCDIVDNYELGSWAPEQGEVPRARDKITMSICLDFSAKQVCVEAAPTLLPAYLKFKDREVEKAAVLETVYTVTKSYFPRLDILSAVIKPFVQGRLAPQKTSTNDMKVTLVVRSKDGEPVIINAREVLADCVSPDSESLLGFKVSGRRVAAPREAARERECPEGLQDMMDMRDPPYRGGRGGGYVDEWGREEHQDMDLHDPWGSGYSRGSSVTNPMFDSYGADADYMEYTSPQEMALSMDRDFAMGGMGGFTRGGSRGGGARGAPLPPSLPPSMPPRAPVHSRLGARPGHRGYDALYEPPFQAGGGGDRNSLFEQARSKLNQRGGGRGTWST